MKKQEFPNIAIQVHPSKLTDKKTTVRHKSPDLVSDIEQTIRDSAHKLIQFVAEKKLNLKPELQQMVDIANEYFLNLINKHQLAHLSSSDLLCSFLNSEDFNQIISEAGHNSPHEVSAVSIYPLDSILIKKNSNLPSYIQASSVVHELIHRWIDKYVHTYSKKSGLLSRLRGDVETSGAVRIGLSLKNGHGAYLNELGNAIWQRNFIKHVLNNPESEQDNLLRIKHLKKLGIRENTSHINYERGGTQCRIDIQNIYFDINGGLILNTANNVFLMAQLVDELSRSIGKIDGESLEVLLLKAKRNLKLQNKIRKAIDNKFGKGFYKRIKNSPYTIKDSLELLRDVQRVIY